MIFSFKQFINENNTISNLNPIQKEIVLSKSFMDWFGDWKNNPKSASKILDENNEPLVCYHGSPNDFYIFDKSRIGTSNDGGYYGKGFYFTFSKENKYIKYAKSEAEYYGKNLKEYFINSINPFDFSLLTSYKEKDINLIETQNMLFLYNVAKMFPKISKNIFLDKIIWQKDENIGNVEKVSISVLVELVNKYSKLLKIKKIKDNGETYTTGWVKSSIEEYDDTKYGGKKGSYIDIDYINNLNPNLSKEETEIYFIIEAIKKYDNLKCNYYIQGIMTRNPEITDEIKNNGYDSIIAGDELVVFEPTQIKLADGTNTTFDKNNPDIRK